jgi:hypothetical protein
MRHRSVCSFRGLRNQEYWFNYREGDSDAVQNLGEQGCQERSQLSLAAQFAPESGWEATSVDVSDAGWPPERRVGPTLAEAKPQLTQELSSLVTNGNHERFWL